MFRIVVERAGEPPRIVELARDSFAIGCGTHAGVVLVGPHVAVDHARVDNLDGAVFVRAHQPIHVNGVEMLGARELHRGDRIAVSEFALAIELVDDDTEERLLAVIEGGDEHSLAIYADWLEEHGEPLRARYLRVQEQLHATTPPDPAAVNELRELSDRLRTDWRMRVARAPIDNCDVEGCPGDWSKLAGSANERACATCNQVVRLCANAGEAIAYARAGGIVALDPIHAQERDYLLRWLR